MWVAVCWCVLAPLLAVVAFFAFELRFAALEQATFVSDRRRVLVRAVLESILLVAVTASTPYGLFGLQLAAINITTTLLADIQLGRQQDRAQHRDSVHAWYA